MSKESVAQALKRLRTNSGLTADEVGSLVGRSGKAVNGWENSRGEPSIEILLKLSKIYNVNNILNEFRHNQNNSDFILNKHEKAIILAYRNKKDMHSAIDKLLDVQIFEESEIDIQNSLEQDIDDL